MASFVLFSFQLLFTKQLLCALCQPLGTELPEQDAPPAGGAVRLMGKSDLKCVSDTHRYRVTVVVSVDCGQG